jgi:hypothetical protein
VVSFPNSFLPWIQPRVFACGYVTLKAVMKMFRNRWHSQLDPRLQMKIARALTLPPS